MPPPNGGNGSVGNINRPNGAAPKHHQRMTKRRGMVVIVQDLK